MKRSLYVFMFAVTFFYINPGAADAAEESTLWDTINQSREEIADDFQLRELFQDINRMIHSVINAITGNSDEPPEDVEDPDLHEPTDQLFSIHNIEMGDDRSDVEAEVGSPERSSLSEYGLEWVTYHDQYRNYVQVMYDEEEQVRGLYTNQDLISSSSDLSFGSLQEDVRGELGEPESYLRKGLIRYQLDGDGEHDVFAEENQYVTVFYDVHEESRVTALQIIDEEIEQSRSAMYRAQDESLRDGFEYQLFDLTNAERVKRGLAPLTWDEAVRSTARDHSQDMADQQFFSHTNPEGESPFDRMDDDGISYRTAGENLAYGQWSSIFAHEGLMNSAGHRENILQGHFDALGVGVAFNEDDQPYYTEKFFSP
ncbi:CAP-associated domain-containing protein [Geomicrobium sp. JSM 1781026]|uniref:CAP domain-containing protein n=1 Tax=Geomicrobium sp. JSM 1781026 TaxID=3344580 RepID=UPI0035BFD22B